VRQGGPPPAGLQRRPCCWGTGCRCIRAQSCPTRRGSWPWPSTLQQPRQLQHGGNAGHFRRSAPWESQPPPSQPCDVPSGARTGCDRALRHQPTSAATASPKEEGQRLPGLRATKQEATPPAGIDQGQAELRGLGPRSSWDTRRPQWTLVIRVQFHHGNKVERNTAKIRVGIANGTGGVASPSLTLPPLFPAAMPLLRSTQEPHGIRRGEAQISAAPGGEHPQGALRLGSASWSRPRSPAGRQAEPAGSPGRPGKWCPGLHEAGCNRQLKGGYPVPLLSSEEAAALDQSWAPQRKGDRVLSFILHVHSPGTASGPCPICSGGLGLVGCGVSGGVEGSL